MKITYGILTLAVAAAIAGCNSLSTSSMDAQGTPADQYQYGSTNGQTPPDRLSNGSVNASNLNNPADNSQRSYAANNPGSTSSINGANSAYPNYQPGPNINQTGASNQPGNMNQPGSQVGSTNQPGTINQPSNQPDSRLNDSISGSSDRTASGVSQPGNASDNTSANSSANADNGSVDQMHQPAAEHPQVAGRDKQPTPSALSDQDRQFIQSAMASGDFEVQSSQAALTRSDSQQVKTLAQDMLNDHNKANGELANLASREGYKEGPALTTDQADKLASLNKLNGQAFDNEYLRQQKQAHQDAIALFQTEASSGDDHFVKDWASETLPTLRNHLDMINALSGTNIGMAQ